MVLNFKCFKWKKKTKQWIVEIIYVHSQIFDFFFFEHISAMIKYNTIELVAVGNLLNMLCWTSFSIFGPILRKFLLKKKKNWNAYGKTLKFKYIFQNYAMHIIQATLISWPVRYFSKTLFFSFLEFSCIFFFLHLARIQLIH